MLAVISSEYLLSPSICNLTELDHIVNSLVNINKQIDSNNTSFFVFEPDIVNVIFGKMQKYPHDLFFKENTIFSNEECAYSARDVARYVNQILNKLKDDGFQKYIDLVALDWDINKKIDPPVIPITSLSYPHRIEDLEQLLYSIAIYQNMNTYCLPLLHYADHLKIIISGTIKNIEPNSALNVTFPYEFKEEISLSKSLYDIYLTVNPLELYQQATTQQDSLYALYIGVFQRRNQLGLKRILEIFQFSDAFLSSLEDCQCGKNQEYASICFNKIVEILSERNHRNISALRINNKSTSKQVEKDGYKAYRVQITKSHQAIRLMFWMNENNEIILANVANKHDVRIIPIDNNVLHYSSVSYMT